MTHAAGASVIQNAVDLSDDDLSDCLTHALSTDNAKLAAAERKAGISWATATDPDPKCLPLGLWALLAEYKRRHARRGEVGKC